MDPRQKQIFDQVIAFINYQHAQGFKPELQKAIDDRLIERYSEFDDGSLSFKAAKAIFDKAQQAFDQAQQTFDHAKQTFYVADKIYKKAEQTYKQTTKNYKIEQLPINIKSAHLKAMETYNKSGQAYMDAQLAYKKSQEDLMEAQETHMKAKQVYVEDQRFYPLAQRILFEIYYYSRRNYIDYETTEHRLKDIKQALTYMIAAYNLPEEILPKINVQTYLDNELQGNLDLILGQPIYSSTGFSLYRNKMKMKKELPCIPPVPGSKSDYYCIELSQEQLNTAANVRYMANGQEIAQLELGNSQIVLKSSGRNIHLRFQEGAIIRAPIIKIVNPRGKIRLRGNIISQQGLYLHANSQQLHYSGTVRAKTEVNIKTNGELIINKYGNERSNGIYAEQQVFIQAASLVYSAKIESNSLIKISAECVQVKHGASHRTANLIVSAKNIPRLAGTFTCTETLVFDVKESIYLTSRTLLSAYTRATILAGACLLARHAIILTKTENIVFKIKNKLRFDASASQTRLGSDGRTLMAGKDLVIQADVIENYAALAAKNNIYIELKDGEGIMTHHASGFLYAGSRLTICGGSVSGGVRIEGGIYYGEEAWFKLNGPCVRGFTTEARMLRRQKPENLTEFLDKPHEFLGMPSILGGENGDKPLNIVCLVYLSFLTYTKAYPIYIIGGAARLNILDLAVSNSLNEKAPIEFDLGLQLPNVTIIFNNIKKFISRTLTHIENKEFSKIAEDLSTIIQEDVLTARNAMTTLAVSRTLISLFAPEIISKIVKFFLSAGILAMNLSHLIVYCKKLSEQDHVEPWQYYYLVGFILPIASLSTQVFCGTESLSSFDFNSANLLDGPNFSPQDLAMAAMDTVSLFGPRNTRMSLVSVDAGFHVTGVDVHQTLVGASYGADVGLIIDHSSIASKQGGLEVGPQVSHQGVRAELGPLLIAGKVNVDVNDASFTGKIISDHTQFSGERLSLNADITAKKVEVGARNLQVTTKIIADNVQFAGEHLTLTADITAKEDCKIIASNRLNEEGPIHANNIVLTAPHLHVDEKLAAYETATLITQDLDLSPKASLESAGSLEIQAKSGDLLGHVHAKQLIVGAADNTDIDVNRLANDGYQNITVQELAMTTASDVTLSQINPNIDLAITAPHIKIANDIVTKDHDLFLEATQGNLDINANLTAHDVLLQADQGHVDTHKKIETTDTLIIAAKQDIHNTGQLHAGNNVFVHNELGNIYNTGEMIAAHHIQIAAYAGSVFNTCRTVIVPGLYDNVKVWMPAKMIGEDVYVYAKDEVKNNVSDIRAIYDINISAEHGVSFLSDAYSYVSDHHRVKHLWRNDETIVISVLTAYSNIISEKGTIEIKSLDGPITLLSPNFQAKENVLLHANEVTLTGINMATEEIHSRSNWFGLSHSKNERKDEISIPTSMINGGKLTIEAGKGGINIPNANILSHEIDLFSAHDVTISVPLLNHHIHQYSYGELELSYPLWDKLGRYADGDFSDWYAPLTMDINTFSDARNGLALGLNAVNTVIDGVKTANNILSPLRNGNPLALVGDPTKVHLSITNTEMKANYQTIGPNVIASETTLTINAAGTTRFENGVSIQAPQAITITTGDFILSGAKLTSDWESKSQQFSLDPALHGMDIGFTQMKISTKAEDYVPEILQTKEFALQANTLQQHNAEIKADKLNISVDRFSSDAEQNHSQTHQEALQLSTTGDESYSDKVIETIGDNTQCRVSNAKVSFFFKPNLEELGKNITWLSKQQQIQQPVVIEKNTFDEYETNNPVVKIEIAEEEKQVNTEDHLPLNLAIVNNGYNTADQNLFDFKNWMEQNVIGLNLNDGFGAECMEDRSAKSCLSWVELSSDILTTFDKHGVGKHLNGMMVKAFDVENYCEIYNDTLKTSGSHQEAMKDVATQLVKDFFQTEGVTLILKSYKLEALTYPIFALQATLSIAADNRQRVNENIQFVRSTLPNETTVGNYSLFAMTTEHIRRELDQKQQLNNVLATVGSWLK